MKQTLAIVLLTCLSMGGCPGTPPDDPPGADVLVIFHNGVGPSCVDALAWLDTMQAEHPELVVQAYLTTVAANVQRLNEMRAEHGPSQGVSTTYGYLPIIFYKGQGFSGFNDSVQAALAALVNPSFAYRNVGEVRIEK